MGLVDTHCHLQDAAFDEDREDVIHRSLAALDWLVVIGDDLETSRKALALCRPGVYCAAGVHPYHAAHVTPPMLDELRAMLHSGGAVALGEIGLDYYKYNQTPRDVQYAAFRVQLELAAELDLPVVIHNRDANDDLARVLDEYHPKLPGGVMHCFAGDAAFAQRCLTWDFFISFAGNVTFPKAGALRDAAKAVPLDRLLVETDSPYLAPQPVRGKRCEPAYVVHTAETLAQLKGVPPDEFSQQTTENARKLFRMD